MIILSDWFSASGKKTSKVIGKDLQFKKLQLLNHSEKLDQAKVGYIEWNSFKLMAMVLHQSDLYVSLTPFYNRLIDC